MIVFGGRCSYDSVVRQDDDAIVAGADTDFVFRANHAKAVYSTQFAFLYRETFVAVIQHAAQVGHNHLLSGGDIRSPADDLLRFSTAQVNRRHVQVIGIWVRFTGQHLSNVKALEAAFDALNFLQSSDFKSARSQRVGRLLRGEVEVYIFFQPLVRNIHI